MGKDGGGADAGSDELQKQIESEKPGRKRKKNKDGGGGH